MWHTVIPIDVEKVLQQMCHKAHSPEDSDFSYYTVIVKTSAGHLAQNR